jgi:hypothetical protein
MTIGNRKLTSAVPHIQGNNQLMVIVGGGGDKRGGQLWGWDDRKGSRCVETFELHDLATFHAPQSSKRTGIYSGIYSACILSVRLHYQRHNQLVFWVQLEGWLTGVSSVLSYFGIFCNFNIIFDPVVQPDVFSP